MKALKTLVLTALVILSLGASSQAQIILSVDFNAQYYTQTEPGFTGIAYNADLSTPYTIGDYWITAITSGVATGGASSALNPPSDAALWKDYRKSDNGALTLTIGGLAADSQYSFQAWSWKDGLGSNQTVVYTPISGTGGSASSILYQPSVVPVDLTTYTTIMNLTSNSSGQIVMTIYSNTYNGTALNGFTLAPVPEPGTYAMLGLGLLAVGVAFKRRTLTA